MYTFTFRAPLDRVWTALRDLPRAVEYLPGIDGVHVQDASTVLGRLTVTTGASTVAYTGKATVAERDDAGYRLRVVTQGRDSTGAGTPSVTVTAQLRPRPNAGCELRIEIDGAQEGSSAAIVRGFAERIRVAVEQTDATRSGSPAAQPGAQALMPTGALPAYQTPPPPPRGSELPGSTTRRPGWLARLLGFGR